MAGEEHRHDLEERRFQVALGMRRCIAGVKWTRKQRTDIDQDLRASGSIAVNYMEANHAVSKPDFLFRTGWLSDWADSVQPTSRGGAADVETNRARSSATFFRFVFHA